MHVSWTKSPENESSGRAEHTDFVQFISWIVRRKKEEKDRKKIPLELNKGWRNLE